MGLNEISSSESIYRHPGRKRERRKAERLFEEIMLKIPKSGRRKWTSRLNKLNRF